MRLHNTIAITAALVISSAFSAAAQKAVKVEMHDGMGNSVGTAELSPAPKGVNIKLDLKSLARQAITASTFTASRNAKARRSPRPEATSIRT